MDLNNIADMLSTVYLNSIADILSIVGFFISIYTLYLTKKIKQELWSRASIKRRKKQIEDKTKKLAECLNDYNFNKDEIKDLILRVNAELVHLKIIDNKELQKTIKKIKELVEKYKEQPDEKKVRDIKTQLSIIIDELNEQEEVYKLRGH